MTLIAKRVYELSRMSAPKGTMLIPVYDPATGKDYYLMLQDIIPSSDGVYPTWSPDDAPYAVGDRVTWNLKLWQSKSDPNNVIPSEGADWEEVSPPAISGATEEYVTEQIQANINGLAWKAPVKARTTAALAANTAGGGNTTLTANANGAFPAQDGVSIGLNDDILVMNEATQSKNGIYTLTQAGSASTPWVLTRREDADSTAELQNAVVSVNYGTTYGDKTYRQGTDSVTLGSSNVVWTEFNPAGITNGASSNELMKSDGTNATGTGLFSATSGAISSGGHEATLKILGTDGVGVERGDDILIEAGDGNSSGRGGDVTISSGTGDIGTLRTGTVMINRTGSPAYTFISSVPPPLSVYNYSTGWAETARFIRDGTTTVVADDERSTNRITLTTRTGASNFEDGVVIESVATDLTSGSEDFDLILKTMGGGAAAAQALRLKSDKSTLFSGPATLKSYTVATVPAAATYTGAMIFVSDESGGAVPAFSDGTNWRRVTDRAIIS